MRMNGGHCVQLYSHAGCMSCTTCHLTEGGKPIRALQQTGQVQPLKAAQKVRAAACADVHISLTAVPAC